MKYLHIFPNEKFTESYIDFINNLFNMDDHIFLITGKNIDAKLTTRVNVKAILNNPRSKVILLKEMYRCRRIFLHSLFNRELVFLLFIQPWLLKKCNWIVWGGDLYCYESKGKSIKSKLYEVMRKFIFKNMQEITTLVKGDYELAKEWYSVKGKYYHGIYINPIKLEFLDSIEKRHIENNGIINIQIGNSADKNNRHFEMLDLLSKYKNENICIYAPLSYGNREYALSVAEYGKEVYGEKFKPLLNFLRPEEYTRYLASIHIAVFGHERQQALGNIFALLYLGKKVYIRNDVSTWDYLRNQLDLSLSNYLDISKLSFSQFISIENCLNDREKVRMVFDNDYIKKVWENIFRKEG